MEEIVWNEYLKLILVVFGQFQLTYKLYLLINLQLIQNYKLIFFRVRLDNMGTLKNINLNITFIYGIYITNSYLTISRNKIIQITILRVSIY